VRWAGVVESPMSDPRTTGVVYGLFEGVDGARTRGAMPDVAIEAQNRSKMSPLDVGVLRWSRRSGRERAG